MNQYNRKTPEQKVRARKMAEEKVLRSDGSVGRHIVVSDTDTKSVDFIKLHVAQEVNKMLLSLSPGATKVWTWAYLKMDFKNVCIATMDEIALDVGQSKKTVEQSVAELERGGFIKRIVRSVYMVNPKLASRVSPRYVQALYNAWSSGKISVIESDMRKIDAQKRALTTENAKACRNAGLTKTVTLPELDDASPEDQEYLLRRAALTELFERARELGEVI